MLLFRMAAYALRQIVADAAHLSLSVCLSSAPPVIRGESQLELLMIAAPIFLPAVTILGPRQTNTSALLHGAFSTQRLLNESGSFT
jgi:hypothetical protein